MADEKDAEKTIRIELTPAQRDQLKIQTGTDAGAIEFTADELEERIAPAMM